jgi:cbb3-type cytochrome oxidase subunit 3
MSLKHYGGILQWTGRRFWESRQFYSAYIALFVAITNWITIQYKLLLENVPVLNVLFSNIWVFMIVATIVFTIISILGGHYIHRKRQFRLEQALSIEENPYLYKAAPGKERDLMIPMGILQLDALEELLRSNNALTEEKKKQFETYRQGLMKLKDGQSLRRMSK